MSRIVDELPAVVEIDKRIARLREQERQMADRTTKARQKHHAAHAKWEQEAVAAELDGKTAKPAPEPPDDSVRNLVMGRLRADIERAITDRHRAILEHADQINAAAESDITDVLAECRPLLEALNALVVRARGAVAGPEAVADARAAVDPRRTTPLSRRPAVVDLALLVRAVDLGPRVLLDGRDPLPARTLGIQPGATLGQTVKVETSSPPTPKRSGTDEGPTVTVVKTNAGAEL